MICFIIIFYIFSLGCSNDIEIDKTKSISVESTKMTILGRKRAIPFTVDNMRRAYQSLLNNHTASKYPNNSAQMRGIADTYQIETTHYYVKFHPKDSLQYETIENDSILEISDEPFEYDVESEGDRYQDPELEGTNFTYYYSVVPKDYQLPNNVEHEIIANLHFTREDEIGDNPTEIEKQEIDFYYDLNLETLKLTDNLDIEEKEDLYYLFSLPDGSVEQLTYQQALNKGIPFREWVIDFSEISTAQERRRSWHPSGLITVNEDAIDQNIGVNGARVRVRKWGFLVIRRATTNAQGFFITSSTRTKRVKYSVYFKHRPLFIVKAGSAFWNARDIGRRTHKREAWRRHYQGGLNQFYALIHNAAYDYYTRVVPTYNLSSPGLMKRIVGKDWYNANSHYVNNFMSLFTFYDIRITRGSGGKYRGSDGIYATTVHELTHAGHRNMDPGMFSIFESGSCNREILSESWAEGVETIVTNDRYQFLTSSYQSSQPSGGRWNSFRQRQAISQMDEYTPIVEDLIDNLNQNAVNSSWPIDQVAGYSLNQIQTALDNTRDLNTWERKLRENNQNATESNLNTLFIYPNAVRANLQNACN